MQCEKVVEFFGRWRTTIISETQLVEETCGGMSAVQKLAKNEAGMSAVQKLAGGHCNGRHPGSGGQGDPIALWMDG